MDPFSVSTGAVALMGLCVTVAHAIRSFIEKAKRSKAILIKLLDKIEHVRLYLAQLRSISARLSDPEHKSIIVPFDQHACELTMTKLKLLADKIGGAGSTGTIKVTISWMQNRRVTEELLAELDGHQTNITHALLALAAHSSVVTKGTVEDLITGINDLKMNQNPFQEPEASTGPTPSSHHIPSNSTSVLQMWPVQVTRDDFPLSYLDSRDQLADAAYHGEWDIVFYMIELGRSQHLQSWINAARLKHSDSLSELSLWTPLHQAAYLGAPAEIVRQLVDDGAFRTLRTRRTSETSPLPYLDMTASEIAREMGYHDLFDILAPVIRHNVPLATTGRLQERLHSLVENIIGDTLLLRQLRLPDISVLTELESPVIWFPVHVGGVRAWTFQCCLDGRELLLLATHHSGLAPNQAFRISENDTVCIEEPLVTRWHS